MLQIESIYCAKPISLYIVLSVWTAAWALIGVAIGKRFQRPKRYIAIADDETWKNGGSRPFEVDGDGYPIESDKGRPGKTE